MSQKLIFLDLETTGLDTDTCEVIEVAYYSANGGRHQSLMRPQNPIPFEVSGITNIDNSDVNNCELFSLSFAHIDLSRYPKMDYIAVTHNTDFDLSVLERYGIKFNRSICTYKLAWKLLPDLPNHKLGTLRAYFGIPHGDGVAHRADYDVEILEKVFDGLISMTPEVENQELTGENLFNFLVKLSDQAKLEYQDIFHFGEYKGQKISDIAKSDANYLDWLLSNTTDKKLKEYLSTFLI